MQERALVSLQVRPMDMDQLDRHYEKETNLVLQQCITDCCQCLTGIRGAVRTSHGGYSWRRHRRATSGGGR